MRRKGHRTRHCCHVTMPKRCSCQTEGRTSKVSPLPRYNLRARGPKRTDAELCAVYDRIRDYEPPTPPVWAYDHHDWMRAVRVIAWHHPLHRTKCNAHSVEIIMIGVPAPVNMNELILRHWTLHPTNKRGKRALRTILGQLGVESLVHIFRYGVPIPQINRVLLLILWGLSDDMLHQQH